MHSNQGRDGKGTGIKASDAAIAFGCDRCHALIDCSATLSREERVAMWEGAHRATMRWLIENGFLLVSLVETPPPVVVAKPSRKISKGRKLQGRGFEKSDVPRQIAKRADPWPKGRSFPTPTTKAGA